MTTHRQRRLLTALQHNRITRRQRRRNLYRKHSQREVPGDNQSHGAIRLLDSHAQETGSIGTRRALDIPRIIRKPAKVVRGKLSIEENGDRTAGAQGLQSS